jgi:hypothetical protein
MLNFLSIKALHETHVGHFSLKNTKMVNYRKCGYDFAALKCIFPFLLNKSNLNNLTN